MKKSLVVSGAGGQGVMSIGMTIANTAAESGKFVTYLPEYGPQQRGGSAKCTVVAGDERIISPLTRYCDILIAMNDVSYRKFCSNLREGGILIINSDLVTSPVERTDIKVIKVPADSTAAALGNIRSANIVMIGALIGAENSFITEESMTASLNKKFSKLGENVCKLNIAALKRGIEYSGGYSD